MKKEVIGDISDARARLAGAQGPEEQAAANDELSGALRQTTSRCGKLSRFKSK